MEWSSILSSQAVVDHFQYQNFLSHPPLYKLPCNENYLALQVQIASSLTDSHN
uniref:Uncharacterized protein n=1 Tax=Arundo donax TaxID=35708 RepID=A0A0A9AQL2_ARUDO